MSTDWSSICITCKLYNHLGQRFTSGSCFGFGSNDKDGRLEAANFIENHIYHDLRVVLTDNIPIDFKEYKSYLEAKE